MALDGAPIDPIQAGVVQFRSDGPYGVLSASYGCREIERAIEPTDAGGEVVLVFADGREERMPMQTKDATATRLVAAGVELWQAKSREEQPGK